MIAMTTSNSISVNARRSRMIALLPPTQWGNETNRRQHRRTATPRSRDLEVEGVRAVPRHLADQVRFLVELRGRPLHALLARPGPLLRSVGRGVAGRVVPVPDVDRHLVLAGAQPLVLGDDVLPSEDHGPVLGPLTVHRLEVDDPLFHRLTLVRDLPGDLVSLGTRAATPGQRQAGRGDATGDNEAD